MIQATLEERRAALRRRRLIGSLMGKTVMKGSAGKMVDRDALPPAPTPILPVAPVPSESPKKASASILLIRKAKELFDQGKSVPSIAYEMGKDEPWVLTSLLIADKLPEKAQQAISDGKFSRTAALQLLLANPSKLDAIIDGALLIAEVEGKL